VKNQSTDSYATLSYAWGHSIHLKLKKCTLPESKDRTNTKNLHQTIADAANLVRDLDIRYLRIDSLCIIQDDVADSDSRRRHLEDLIACSRDSIKDT
jgi:hypothetical protein